jgi:hypothetical protein
MNHKYTISFKVGPLRRIVFGLIALVLILYVVLPTVRVGAAACPEGMSSLDCDALYGPWQNWVPDTGQCSGGDSSTLDVADLGANTKTAMAYLVNEGKFTPEQAAGIVGNLMAESGTKLDPTATSADGGAYGIAQWRGGRQSDMKAWVAAQGSDPNSFEGQLAYVLHEFNTSENAAKADLLKQHTANDAAFSVYKYYERPDDGSYPTREKNARSVLKQYTTDIQGTTDDSSAAASVDNNATDAEDEDTSTCSSVGATGSVDCTSATGTAKILCEAQPYNGIYYRWGGGHQGYKAFVAGCPDPTNPPNNHPSGAVSDPTNGGLSGNPSPCATDCSGLVSVAVSAAFNRDVTWTVSSLEGDGANWKKISKTDIQAGDVLVKGNDHVEIVDHAQGSSVSTFGSHKTGTKTSLVQTSLGDWDGAYRYIGSQG